MPDQISDILKGNSLKLTKAREQILATFLKFDYALAFSDIEQSITKETDRVTIYRTLSTFEEKGIIHQVIDNGNVVKYAMCRHNNCSAGHHHDSHVHFKCGDCGHTFCLENTSIPQLNFPVGFKAKEVSLLVQGQCNKCA